MPGYSGISPNLKHISMSKVKLIYHNGKIHGLIYTKQIDDFLILGASAINRRVKNNFCVETGINIARERAFDAFRLFVARKRRRGGPDKMARVINIKQAKMSVEQIEERAYIDSLKGEGTVLIV